MSNRAGPGEPGFETLAIHAGQEPDPTWGAVVVPIYQTSTFAQSGAGDHHGFDYSRGGNPTRAALETCLAALDGGAAGFAFASGMAAEDAILRSLLRPGDKVVIPNVAYGGTSRLFDKVAVPWGVRYTAADGSDLDQVARAAVGAKMVWVETPTNPLLGITDLAAVAQVAHEQSALLVVDNTFASPYLQRPIDLGADVVVYSTTKYHGGHSDVIGGAVVTASRDVGELIGFTQFAVGAIAGPFDAWLTLRGVRTLAVRMERHCSNAASVAEYLSRHPAVETVYFPGLADHPGHKVAAAQMRDFGGMVSFSLVGGESMALAVCRATRIFTLAESLGGVESLIEHPARMTHASVRGTPFAMPGNLVRLSVGIESETDLIADLERALATASADGAAT
jgi:cystathionine gamma-synthase